jgi:hypothetical protein
MSGLLATSQDMNLFDSLQHNDSAAAASIALHDYISNPAPIQGQLESASVRIDDHRLVATTPRKLAQFTVFSMIKLIAPRA